MSGVLTKEHQSSESKLPPGLEYYADATHLCPPVHLSSQSCGRLTPKDGSNRRIKQLMTDGPDRYNVALQVLEEAESWYGEDESETLEESKYLINDMREDKDD